MIDYREIPAVHSGLTWERESEASELFSSASSVAAADAQTTIGLEFTPELKSLRNGLKLSPNYDFFKM